MFAAPGDGGHGTDVPRRYKKCTCPDGQSDRGARPGLEVTPYKRLHNGEASPGAICERGLALAFWPHVP
jgi:hypothetical protein